MTINLNKQIVTKEGLLEYISEVDVYKLYSGEDVILNQSMSSPLRKKDDNPSFGYYQNASTGEIYFNDFALGGGDFVQFVQYYFGIPFFDALSKIVVDFNLQKYFFYKPVKTTKGLVYDKPQSKEDVIGAVAPITLTKRRREWRAYDYAYWNQFGIDSEILIKYNVEPIDYIFINDFPIKVDKYAYCFIEYKDNKETYKIYQPYNELYKWRNNHDYSIWQGWTQLPNKNSTLIITKSLKDVMSIVSTTNYPAVALQAESTRPKQHVIDELRNRFDTIYLLYDNDYDKEVNWGQKFAQNLCSQYNILWNLTISKAFKCKDYSDLVAMHGVEKAKEHLTNIINNKLPF